MSSKAGALSNNNIRVLAARSFLRGMRDNMVRVVWQPFVLSLGASMPLLGFLESLGGLSGIVPTLVQPLIGRLSDCWGRKIFILASSVFAIAALSIYVLAKFTDNWRLLIPGVGILGLAFASRPSEDSMTAESAGVAERSRAYSLVMLSLALSGVVAPLLGGFVADRSVSGDPCPARRIEGVLHRRGRRCFCLGNRMGHPVWSPERGPPLHGLPVGPHVLSQFRRMGRLPDAHRKTDGKIWLREIYDPLRGWGSHSNGGMASGCHLSNFCSPPDPLWFYHCRLAASHYDLDS
jgi:hypothetical protein